MKVTAGQNAVVTGAGSGIGRSIALALADRGVNVVVSDIDSAAADAVAAEVAAHGVTAMGAATDVSKQDQVANLADTAYAELGSVHILVNNAGVTLNPFRKSWLTSADDFAWVMGVNFWGVVYGHVEFIPRMLEQNVSAHIVNTSSMSVTTSTAGAAAYTASKKAVDGLSHTARNELAERDIGVSTLHPGKVRSQILGSENRLRENAPTALDASTSAWTDAYIARILAPTKSAGTVDPDVPTTWDDYITPAAVGWVTLRGIELNLPRILTHPWAAEKIRALADDFTQGLPDYSAWSTRD